MSCECQLLQRTAQPALIVRTRTPVFRLGKAIGKAFEAIEAYLAQQNEQPAGPPFVMYYNTNMFALDVEIGFPVKRPLKGTGEIQPTEIPGGKAAACLYKGPYNKIAPAYKALQQWMKTNGYTSGGAPYEYYLNDPNETPPEELQTQIVFPLKG
jgi:effector-binding domain-containing protein